MAVSIAQEIPRRYHDRLNKPYLLEDGEYLDPIRVEYRIRDKFVFRKIVDALFEGITRVELMKRYRKIERTDENCINLLASMAEEKYGFPAPIARKFVERRIHFLMRETNETVARTVAPTAQDLAREDRVRTLKRMRKWRRDYSHRNL